MMMTAIKKSQIVAATVAVIAMSAVATPSHARTVKAAAKKNDNNCQSTYRWHERYGNGSTQWIYHR